MSALVDSVSQANIAPTAARLAIAWLAQTWPPVAPSDALALGALALLQVCRAVDLSGTRVAAEPLEDAIAATTPDPRWTAADLSTSLLAAGAALRIGGAIAGSARAYLDAFADLAREDLLHGPGGALARLALHGASTAPRGDSIACPVDISPGDAASVRAALDTIEIASRFGTRAVAAGPSVAPLLEGAAMAALRAYDLPLGMRTLRARRYLDAAPTLGLSTGLSFLRLLQGEDGGFGDFDTVLTRLAASGEPDAALRLRLPITVQALWTIAELDHPGFRVALLALPQPAQRSH